MSPPTERRSRPHGPAQVVGAGRQDNEGTILPPHDLGRRLAWAVPLIRRGRKLGLVPPYGSASWCDLPPTDARKVAAVVIAAECWWQEVDPVKIRERLEDELAVQAQLEGLEWDRALARVRRINSAPSFARRLEQWRGEAS